MRRGDRKKFIFAHVIMGVEHEHDGQMLIEIIGIKGIYPGWPFHPREADASVRLDLCEANKFLNKGKNHERAYI